MSRPWPVAIVLILACGRADTPTPPTPIDEGAPRPEQFCAEYARASCAMDARCAPASVTSETECVARVTAECEGDRVPLTPETIAAISGRRLEWRRAEAAACLKLLEGPCANRELQDRPFMRRLYGTVFLVDPCERLWKGTTLPRAACDHPLECAAGVCDESGHCPAAAEADAACTGDAGEIHCAAPYVCDRTSRTCKPPVESCTLDGECATVCGPNRYGLYECFFPAPLGGSCSYHTYWSHTETQTFLVSPCQPGLACIGLDGSCALPRTEGAPCDRIRECAAGLTCLSSGTCGRFRGEGEPCESPVARERYIEYRPQGAASPESIPVWSGEGGDCDVGLACMEGTCRRPAST